MDYTGVSVGRFDEGDDALVDRFWNYFLMQLETDRAVICHYWGGFDVLVWLKEVLGICSGWLMCVDVNGNSGVPFAKYISEER